MGLWSKTVLEREWGIVQLIVIFRMDSDTIKKSSLDLLFIPIAEGIKVYSFLVG